MTEQQGDQEAFLVTSCASLPFIPLICAREPVVQPFETIYAGAWENGMPDGPGYLPFFLPTPSPMRAQALFFIRLKTHVAARV